MERSIECSTQRGRADRRGAAPWAADADQALLRQPEAGAAADRDHIARRPYARAADRRILRLGCGGRR